MLAANRLTLAAVPLMREAGKGRVINTASGQLHLAGKLLTAYTGSQHTLAGLTKQQALELGPLGITRNALEPGFIVTGISKGYTDLMSSEEVAEFEFYWAGKPRLAVSDSPSMSPTRRCSRRRILGAL